MSDHPEVLLSDNPHGIMFFGPGGGDDDGAQYTMATSSGSMVHYNRNGSKTELVRTSSHEICGDDLVKDRKTLEKEVIAKSTISFTDTGIGSTGMTKSKGAGKTNFWFNVKAFL